MTRTGTFVTMVNVTISGTLLSKRNIIHCQNFDTVAIFYQLANIPAVGLSLSFIRSATAYSFFHFLLLSAHPVNSIFFRFSVFDIENICCAQCSRFFHSIHIAIVNECAKQQQQQPNCIYTIYMQESNLSPGRNQCVTIAKFPF